MIRRFWLAAFLALCALPLGAQPLELRMTYLTRDYAPVIPLSLLETPAKDEGLLGARLANQENALTGRFLGQSFELTEVVLGRDAPFPQAAVSAVSGGARYIIADLNADDLLALADLPEAQDDIILNTRAHDDALRLRDCRANVWHIAPSWAMKADGLAQYLVWKRWTDWFLMSGDDPDDLAYADAFERAAKKFGAQIVERREYAFEAGSKRVESGHQQIQTQMPLMTQRVGRHDVVVVSDVNEDFGEYLLYRTDQPRPVVGTHGLVSASWHRSFEQFGSMSLHSAFQKLANRPITSRDYLNWLAVKTVAEPAIRLNTADPAAIRRAFLDPQFKVPGFKGIGLSFRPWNQQMRQPMLIAWHRALVSMSPQDAFLHERHTLDSLGFDQPETQCNLNPTE